MPNLYGIARPEPAWIAALIFGGANVTCPAGVETNVLDVIVNPPLIGGVYGLVITCNICVIVGATPITYLAVGGRMNGGADFISLSWGGGTDFVAGAQSQYSFFLPQYSGFVQNPGVTHAQVSLNPQSGSVTAQSYGTSIVARWQFAPDQ